jgi:hypothetical protein
MADAVMAHTRELNSSGASVWPQVSPRSGFDLRFVFDGSSLNFAAMPSWVAMCMAQRDDKVAMLSDDSWRAKSREE